jgi:stage II sporulation protein D
MRRLLTLTVLALALSLGGAASAAPTFVITGAGWGHGIGMAQYGAYGFAQHGWTYDRILAHYYPGTELGSAPAARIRVLLIEGARELEIGSEAAFSVEDRERRLQLPGGVYRIGTELTVEIEGKERTLAGSVRFRPGTKPLELNGQPYRGALVVSRVGSRLTAVNDVRLEQYLFGVVPGEIEAEWHPEALRAQAVAARSYALASRKSGEAFDVFADTRSQVYRGIGVEDTRTNAAVRATTGQVVLYRGKVAWTFFFASSGGRTAAIQDVWLGAEPLPYLVSVDDPYDDVSPYHRWGPLTFTVKQLRQKLGSRIPAGLEELRVNANDSGRVASVTAIGAARTTEISGWTMRALLGLRSTWFSIGREGDLVASARRIVFGGAVSLSGVVDRSGRVTIEHRPAGGQWSPLRIVRVDGDGRVGVSVRPTVTTSFRLRVGSDVGAAVRVAVAPELSLVAAKRPGRMAGMIRPVLADVAVTIERRTSSAWKRVTSAVTDERGRYRVSRDLTPGVYRARVAPVAGLVAGTSSALSVRNT